MSELLKLEIVVSEDDLIEGLPWIGTFNRCPVSRAILRQGHTAVDVDEDRLLFTTPGGARLFCATPRGLSLFIDKLDNREVVKPSVFVLEGFRTAELKDERSSPSADGCDNSQLAQRDATITTELCHDSSFWNGNEEELDVDDEDDEEFDVKDFDDVDDDDDDDDDEDEDIDDENFDKSE